MGDCLLLLISPDRNTLRIFSTIILFVPCISVSGSRMIERAEMWLLCLMIPFLLFCGTSCVANPISDQPGTTEYMITNARQDLAQRLNLPLDKVILVKIEPVDWPDASLGSPEPSKIYAQVITPGYRIILSDGVNQYEYHSDSQNKIVYSGQN